MNYNSEIILVDVLGRQLLVDPSQVPELETILYDAATILCTIEPVLAPHIINNVDAGLFVLLDPTGSQITEDQWRTIVQNREPTTITMNFAESTRPRQLKDSFRPSKNVIWNFDGSYRGTVNDPDLDGGPNFRDPTGRISPLSKEVCKSYEAFVNFVRISFRAVEPLNKEIQIENFGFIGDGASLSERQWIEGTVKEIKMEKLLEERSKRKQSKEIIQYPGRGNIVRYSGRDRSGEQLTPSLKFIRT